MRNGVFLWEAWHVGRSIFFNLLFIVKIAKSYWTQHSGRWFLLVEHNLFISEFRECSWGHRQWNTSSFTLSFDANTLLKVYDVFLQHLTRNKLNSCIWNHRTLHLTYWLSPHPFFLSFFPSRCSILACSAYVALALGDNLMALNHADKLLQQPKLSGSLK